MYKSQFLGAVYAGIVTVLLSATANASTFNFTFTGVLSAQLSSGALPEDPFDTSNSWSGFRSDISGTFSFNIVDGTGTIAVDPFTYAGAAMLIGGTAQAIGDGSGMTGDLVVANLTYNFNSNGDEIMDVVWDAGGLFDALALGMTPGDTISGSEAIIGGVSMSVGSVLPVSNSANSGAYPIGPTALATTANDVAPGTFFPLISDPSGIGGSPNTGSLSSRSISLDIGDAGTMTLISITPETEPPPPVVNQAPLTSLSALIAMFFGLFGSGFIVLSSMAKRK